MKAPIHKLLQIRGTDHALGLPSRLLIDEVYMLYAT